MTPNETMAYSGTCPGCGNMVAVTVDTQEHSRENAKFVAQMIRDGLIVERITVQQSRERIAMCECAPNPRRKATDAAQESLSLGAP